MPRNKLFKFSIVTILIFIVAYTLLLSDYNGIFKNKSFTELNKSIRNSQNEDLKPVLEIYSKMYGNNYQKRRDCPCYQATNYIGPGPYRNGFSLTKKLYNLKIEKEFTEEDCLKFEFLNADFLYGNIGIRQASKYYYNKEMKQLDEKQIISLILMLENPALHNPKRERDVTKLKIEFYQKYINKKR